MNPTKKSCTPCNGNTAPFSRAEALSRLSDIPEWKLADDTTFIERRFTFRSFAVALAFAQKIGQLAEIEGHHPELTIGWGFCNVRLKTNKINGLHENDFIMAVRINEMIDQPDGFQI